MFATLGALIMTPAIAFVTSPLWKRSTGTDAGYSDAGPLDGLTVGQWKLLSINLVRQDGWTREEQTRSIWVRRNSAGQRDLTVFSPNCTHLGCPVSHAPGASEFICPCHGGHYDNNGARVSGPPPRGLDPLDFDIRDDHLWVRWQDFKVGVPERVATQA